MGSEKPAVSQSVIGALSAILLWLVLPGPAQAHRPWLLPSATIVSGSEPWVTVDAAVSDSLFYADHNAMGLDGLKALAPDGTTATPENVFKGRLRSSFDLRLAQTGTYKLSVLGDSLNASFKVGGEARRLRGTAESLSRDIPADAEGLQVSRSQSRVEAFISSGRPSDKVLAPVGQGLELVPVTHPNDLVAGESASFKFMLDGQPAAGLPVTVVPGGIRYRDGIGEIKVVTDTEGRFSVRWPGAGMYYLTASHGASPRSDAPTGPGAATRGTLQQPLRRASYGATLEVLPP